MAERCRLCTANDREALVDEIAERMWDSRRDYEFDPSWPDAGPHWHKVLRALAKRALAVIADDG